jgi:UDP-2,4-diacetamido-2,4,6-trideoxy-beta-L-altropyranose hydrolase
MRRALFRCDASAVMGAGHVMRCLTLAHALAARGWTCAFATLPASWEAAPALTRSGFGVIALDDPLAPAALAQAAGGGWDLIVFDHYALGADHETACRPIGVCLMALDDLADRRHDVDLLLDQTFGRDAAAYRALVPHGAQILAGSGHALLRPEFARARSAALASRTQDRPVRSVLVSLGFTDVGAITALAAAALAPILGEAACAVVIGPAAPSRQALEALCARDGRFQLHVDPPDLAGLMARADLSLGAAGATSWERCCLGLPGVMLMLAPNQREAAALLANAGAACVAADVQDAAGLLADLMGDAPRRHAMAQAAAALCDGAGAARVADAIETLMRARRAA